MNWKRGFRRIAFVLSGIAGIICAGMSVFFVFVVRDGAQSHLRSEKANYTETYHYGITPEQARAELEKRKRIKELIANSESKLPEGFILDKPEEQKELAELNRLAGEVQQTGLTPAEQKELAELKQRRAEIINQQQRQEAEIVELQKGFWVNLSFGGLVGVYISVGLIGWIIGFGIVWLIYKFLEWLVLGFCGNNRLQSEKT